MAPAPVVQQPEHRKARRTAEVIGADRVLPATAAPSEKPKNIIMTTVARLRWGEYSAVSAIALGIAPPRPRPVRKRQATRPSTDDAVGVRSMNAPKIKRQAMITHLRPTRSATMPKSRAPAMSPSRPLTITGHKAEGAIFMDLAMAGSTYPTICVSKPSMKTASAHSTATEIWKRPIRPRSISCATSTTVSSAMPPSTLCPGSAPAFACA